MGTRTKLFAEDERAEKIRVREGRAVYLYYGVCDTAIALATAELEEVVRDVMAYA